MWFVELAKAVAWPVAVVTVAFIFKPELLTALPSFVRRSIGVKIFGIEANVGAAEQQQTAEKPASGKITTNLPTPSPRIAVRLIEEELSKNLLAIKEEDREASLLRVLAIERVNGTHEYVYNRIFGSQIAGLRALNERSRVSIDDATIFFAACAGRFPEVYKGISFDNWISFLTSQKLARRTGDTLEITEFGRDFLVYLTERRLTEAKPW